MTYEESLIKGRFVGRGWNGSGFVNFYDGRIKFAEHATPEASWIEVDGQALISDWPWPELDGTPSAGRRNAGELRATVTLKHAFRPVKVAVHTKLDGADDWTGIEAASKRLN